MLTIKAEIKKGELKAIVDKDDIHCLMIGASGVGKTAFFLYANMEYACASGMSFLALDTKGDLARNYGTIAKNYYGYNVSVIDLRNPTRSDGNNLLTLINRYMDIARENPDNLAARAKAEKYAKILAKTIVEVGLPKDHTLVEVKTPETCQTTAKTETKCSVCGTVTKTVGGLAKADAKACDYSVWKVVKESTVFEEGMKKVACSVCGQLEHEGSSIAIAKKTVAKASNTVKAGKKSFNVKSSAANATGYRVYYKKAGAKSWKSYTKKTTSLSKTFSGLSKGKYYVKVRAYAKNYDGDGQVVWGATSSTKSVKVK